MQKPSQYLISAEHKAQRQAAWGMQQLNKHYGFGNMAEQYAGDNASEWAVINPHNVIALKNGFEVAKIFIENNTVHIEVADNYRLIRDSHLGEYEPEAFDIEPHQRTNPITLEKMPEIEADIDIPEEVTFDGPRVEYPRSQIAVKVRVIASLGLKFKKPVVNM